MVFIMKDKNTMKSDPSITGPVNIMQLTDAYTLHT